MNSRVSLTASKKIPALPLRNEWFSRDHSQRRGFCMWRECRDCDEGCPPYRRWDSTHPARRRRNDLSWQWSAGIPGWCPPRRRTAAPSTMLPAMFEGRWRKTERSEVDLLHRSGEKWGGRKGGGKMTPNCSLLYNDSIAFQCQVLNKVRHHLTNC